MTTKYYDNYQPALKTGKYTIEVTQTLLADELNESFKNTADFEVKNEYSLLTKQSIQSVYPPMDGQGNFDEILPKIVLKDASLPWQNSNDNQTPNLALLLFEVEELAIEDWSKVSRTGAFFLNEEPEKMFVEIPVSYINECFPKKEELPFLAFVQTANDIDFYANIFTNRTPKPNSRNIIHLVDLQSINYSNNDNHFTKSNNDKISFPSLFSWEFYCEAPKEEFETVAKNLIENHQLLRLNIKQTINNEKIKTILEGGYIPVKYETQQGEHTTAFYRSPLVPNLINNQNFAPNFSAESAMIYDTDIGMFDLSYSVAWQTGRLMALSDTYFSQNLLKWKQKANSFLDTFFAKQQFYKRILTVINKHKNTNFTLDDLMSNNFNHLLINSLQTAMNNLGLAARGDLGGIRTQDELVTRAVLELENLSGVLDFQTFENIEDSPEIYDAIIETLF